MKPQIFIHPHDKSIPGSSMAGYGDPMPDKSDYYPDPDGQYFDEVIYNRDLRYWQQSMIGYTKEPEWRYQVISTREFIGDIVYLIGGTEIPYKISSIPYGDKIFIEGLGLTKRKDLSHYYPGQKMSRDSFRWVEKVVSNVNACGDDEWGEMEKVVYEWQPVDEPEESAIHYYGTGPNPKYTSFQDKVNKWQIMLEEIKK